jgi:RecA-family ATPase
MNNQPLTPDGRATNPVWAAWKARQAEPQQPVHVPVEPPSREPVDAEAGTETAPEPEPTISAMGQVALDLAKVGLHVFPCNDCPEDKANDKAPKEGIVWPRQATANENTIRFWWKRWPDALPAIALKNSNLIVLDPDRHEGRPDGVAALSELEAANEALPDHPIILTAGGGEHHIFTQRDGESLGNSEGGLKGKGINVRGSGGYAIAAGAQRANGARWAESDGSPSFIESVRAGTIPPLTDWVADLIRNPAFVAPNAAAPSATISPGEVSNGDRAWARKALDGNTSDLATVGEGGRNNALNAAAFRMGGMVARGWIDQQEVEAALWAACEANGLVREGAHAVRKTIRSGLTDGLKKPHADIQRGSSDDVVFAPRGAPGENDREPGDGPDGEQPKAGPNGDSKPPPDIDELESVCAASLAGQPVSPRKSIVDSFIPDSSPSLFMGDGGTGKSLIALQLAVAMDSGSDWLRLPVCGGPVVFLTAEDDLPEVHRRLEAVCFAANVDMAQLTGLHIPSLAGKDAVLATFNGRNGAMEPTPIWRKLEKLVVRTRPKLVILDTLADIFGGDEISRRQTRSFVGLCRGMAIERECGVLLLGHPSVSGMMTGTGTSGSTGWSNSMRSRLYIERVIQDRVEMDPNVRVITVKKANYAPVGNQIRVRWKNGCFTREDGDTTGSRPAGAAAVDSIFLEILGLYETQGREVSPNKSPSYAPKMFADHERAKASNLTAKALAAAMERLLETGAIKVDHYGPPSKRRSKLVIVESDSNPEGED